VSVLCTLSVTPLSAVFLKLDLFPSSDERVVGHLSCPTEPLFWVCGLLTNNGCFGRTKLLACLAPQDANGNRYGSRIMLLLEYKWIDKVKNISLYQGQERLEVSLVRMLFELGIQLYAAYSLVCG
jgi:hypothetical protein